MVVHVDKIKMCRGETPKSWIEESEERLVDRIEQGAFIDLFDESSSARDADIINDIKNDIQEEERRARPKRNAPMPAIYIQRIYAIQKLNKVDACYRGDFQEVEGFSADEARQVADDVESTDGQEIDQVEVAGRAFIAAHLHLHTPGETGKTIGKTRGPLGGCGWTWSQNFIRGIHRTKMRPRLRLEKGSVVVRDR